MTCTSSSERLAMRAGFRSAGAALILGCANVLASELEVTAIHGIDSVLDTNGDSQLPNSVSADGRYAAFGSSANNLVEGDSNGRDDIFVFDKTNGVVTLESVATDGTQGNGNAHVHGVGLSASGRYLVFASVASNLAPGADGVRQIFLRDRTARTTRLISRSSSGVVGNGPSFFPKLTPDGRYVVFTSQSSNLAAGDANNAADVFRHDLLTGQTLRVSLGAGGVEAQGTSQVGFLSDNGQVVTFLSDAPNLVPGDSNGATDVFVRDVNTGMTQRASVSTTGSQLGAGLFGGQWDRAISGGGRYVVFDTIDAADPGDTNGVLDVYRFDRTIGTSQRVSLGVGGVQGNSRSVLGILSGDGQKVMFTSFANNLVSGDLNGVDDVFVRDVQAGTTERRSLGAGGTELQGNSSGFSMTPDTETVSLQSLQGLTPDDVNGLLDVYQRSRSGSGLVRMSQAVRAQSIFGNSFE